MMCKDICGDSLSVGISLASPEHIKVINNYKEKVEIQFNLSWFDLRALPYLHYAKQQGHILTARSLFASGILDMLASSADPSDSAFFASHDIRSKWDLSYLFEKCSADCQRVKALLTFFESANIPSLAFSLLSVVDCLDNIVIGPLNNSQLFSSLNYYNLKYDPELVAKLRSFLPG